MGHLKLLSYPYDIYENRTVKKNSWKILSERLPQWDTTVCLDSRKIVSLTKFWFSENIHKITGVFEIISKHANWVTKLSMIFVHLQTDILGYFISFQILLHVQNKISGKNMHAPTLLKLKTLVLQANFLEQHFFDRLKNIL